MSRKADMSIQTVVVAALAMIVLIILIVIFKTQIGNLAGGFTSTGNSAKSGLAGKTCQTLIGGRVCDPTEANYPRTNYTWELVPKPTCTPEQKDAMDKHPGDNKYVCDDWSDCLKKNCYEITSTR